ncbi:hypothetical protein, partial [Plesiomonas shigelloides]|uniref:hypothetical protein n=1 Tax=Plesiomonas shigelloides TaxID=703 RepID=UPI001C48B249
FATEVATGSELFRNPVLLSRKCFAFSQEPIFITAGQSVICITAAVSVGSHYRAFCGGRKGKVIKTIHPLHFHPKRQKNTLFWS